MSRRIKKKHQPSKSKNHDNEVDISYDKDIYSHLKKSPPDEINITAKGINYNLIVGIFLIGIIIIAMIMSGVFNYEFTGDSNNNGGSGVEDNNGNFVLLTDQCTKQVGLHYHILLRVSLFGNPQIIPPNIGITSDCMRPIHTHDPSGQIHLELPKGYNGKVTLGDFFTIWSEFARKDFQLSSTQLLGMTGTVNMTSEGVTVDISNPANYVLVYVNQDFQEEIVLNIN